MGGRRPSQPRARLISPSLSLSLPRIPRATHQAALPLIPGAHTLAIPCWRPNDVRIRDKDELFAHYTGLRPELINEDYVHARARLTVQGQVLPHKVDPTKHPKEMVELATQAAVPPWERPPGGMYQDYVQTIGMGTVHVQARAGGERAPRCVGW